jgi:hypothetical protein
MAVPEMTYARLLVADPARWRATARGWRLLAQWTGQRAAELGPQAARLRAAWSGAAAGAAAARLGTLCRALQRARLGWWEADQALSEFAAGLARARALLDAAVAGAGRAGLVIDAEGVVRPGPVLPGTVAASQAVRDTAAAIGVALTVAARADADAANRLTAVAAAARTGADPAPPSTMPACGAPPTEVRRWWDGLTPAQRRWLVVAGPAAIGALDGVPAAYRDQANRLRLDELRGAVERDLAGAVDTERGRLRRLRAGLDALADRLADDDGARAYLLRLDPAGDGRAVVALGDPDRADNVLTHVPGMTSDLMSVGVELDRAGRIATRAEQLAPGESTSAVLWLDYDAPDFLGEAAGAGPAHDGATALHRFQDGLRVTHDGPPSHQTVVGHSYGSLVVGTAAARGGLAADSIVFVGSPGVGVDSAADLHAPPGQVWASTSRSDPIGYAALAPGGALVDAVRAAVLPVIGAVTAFGLPEDDLWHGHNPSDPGFGARVFATQTDAGHLGYWEPGRPALDNLARITLGGGYQAGVR